MAVPPTKGWSRIPKQVVTSGQQAGVFLKAVRSPDSAARHEAVQASRLVGLRRESGRGQSTWGRRGGSRVEGAQPFVGRRACGLFVGLWVAGVGGLRGDGGRYKGEGTRSERAWHREHVPPVTWKHG